MISLSPLNNIIIRSANSADVNQMLPLMAQLGYPQTLTELTERFNYFIAQTDYNVTVAEQDDKIVGWIAWSKSILFVSSTTRIHIEGLIVDETCRGQKIGKALMAHVEEIAKNFSPCIIDLTSGLRRAKDGSHKFYQSLGYHNDGHLAKLYLRKYL